MTLTSLDAPVFVGVAIGVSIVVAYDLIERCREHKRIARDLDKLGPRIHELFLEVKRPEPPLIKVTGGRVRLEPDCTYGPRPTDELDTFTPRRRVR